MLRGITELGYVCCMKNTKQKAQVITIVVLLAVCAISWVYIGTTDAFPTQTECGTVLGRPSFEHVHKRSTSVSFYLLVQFDKTGFKTVDCDRDTYHKFDRGNRICFDLPKEPSVTHKILVVWGYVSAILIPVILVAGLFAWLITND